MSLISILQNKHGVIDHALARSNVAQKMILTMRAHVRSHGLSIKVVVTG